MGEADVADVPVLGEVAGEFLLVGLVAYDEAVVPAIGGEPDLLGRALEYGVGDGDIKR